MNLCGVYKITNKVTKQSYIGKSIQIEERWKQHIHGKGNKPLYNDIQQLGLEHFQFEILELCDEAQLIEREKYWINFYDTFHNGYNQNEGGDSNYQAIQATQKIIYCYDLAGNFLEKYNSLMEAERILHINNANICRAAKTQGRTGQYQWRYKYSEKIAPYKRKTNPVNNHPSLSKSVIQYDKNMIYLHEYPSAKEAERQTGIKCAGISAVCQHHRKTAGGYIWQFKEEVSNA